MTDSRKPSEHRLKLRRGGKNVAGRKEEARRLLSQHLSRPRAWSYDSLRDDYAGEGVAETVLGADGTEYQIETQSFLDDRRTGRLRVTAGIDGGPVSATRPLSDGFLVEPPRG